MAIERRANGRIYHFGYADKRPSGTTIRAYFGSGPAAEWLTQVAAEHRAERHRRAANEQRQRRQILGAVRLGRAAAKAAKQVMTDELAALGYHQHDRGLWRKRKNGKANSMARTLRVEELDDFRPPPIRPFKRRDYAFGEQAIELADAATAAWFDMLSDMDAEVGERLRAQLQQLRERLLEPGNSRLEQICVARIVICTLEVQMASLRIATSQEISASHASFLLERQNAAVGRLATAVRALRTARRIFKRELERNRRPKRGKRRRRPVTAKA